MQITIDSSELLEIFIEAGIGQTDAKALILDILMLQEKPKAPPAPPKKEIVAKQTTSTDHVRLKPVTQLPSQTQKTEEEEVEQTDDYSINHEESEEERPTVTRVNSKSMSRPSFSSFGGDSTGLIK